MKADTKEQQQSGSSTGRLEKPVVTAPNKNGEDQRWVDSLEFILEYVLKNRGTGNLLPHEAAVDEGGMEASGGLLTRVARVVAARHRYRR